MTHDDYYIETPALRRYRRHEEDKISNPDRHLLTQDFYTREEMLSLCVWCTIKFCDLYKYDPQNNGYRKIT